MSSIIANIKGYKVEYKRIYPRPDKNLKITFPLSEAFRARHDFEREEFDAILNDNGTVRKYGKPRQLMSGYEQKKPMPQTVMSWQLPSYDGGFVPFTREWQFRYYELFEWAIGGRLPKGEPTGRYWKKINGKKVYVPKDPFVRVEYTPRSMMELWEDMFSDSVALTDQHAFDNGCADYIQGLNLDAPPMSIKRLFFGGSVFRKIGMENQYTRIETLDPSSPPPKLQWILDNKPYLIQWTTEIGCLPNQKLPDNRYTVAMFGKFKRACDYFGWERVGVPYFVFGKNGWNRIKNEHIIKLNSEEYTPYVP